MPHYVTLACCLILLLAVAGCEGPATSNQVTIETAAGDIIVEVYPDKAPQTAGRFLEYVDAGYYRDASFYRILSTDNQPMGANAAELIQGGLYKSREPRTDLPGIPHEPTSVTGINHLHGTVSMARQEPGTATTEFFICIGDQPGFDEGGANNEDGAGYAAFGRVIKGMDVVMKIYRRPEENQYFLKPVAIRKIVRR